MKSDEWGSDKHRRFSREAFGRARYRARTGRDRPWERIPSRQRLCRHLGYRPPGSAGAAARDQSAMAAVAARSPSDASQPLAAGGVREDQTTVRGREKDPRLASDIL